jgi:5-methylcytosine-specific restriction endonuclease McrA
MKPIPAAIRDYILRRDKHRCRLCQRPVERGHIHHIYRRYEQIPTKYEVPRVKGNNHPSNLILLCPECHGALHSSVPAHLKEILLKWNLEMEYLHPYPREVKEWLEKNSIGNE